MILVVYTACLARVLYFHAGRRYLYVCPFKRKGKVTKFSSIEAHTATIFDIKEAIDAVLWYTESEFPGSGLISIPDSNQIILQASAYQHCQSVARGVTAPCDDLSPSPPPLARLLRALEHRKKRALTLVGSDKLYESLTLTSVMQVERITRAGSYRHGLQCSSCLWVGTC